MTKPKIIFHSNSVSRAILVVLCLLASASALFANEQHSNWSVYDGHIQSIQIVDFKEGKTLNSWLGFGRKLSLGFYPTEHVGVLADSNIQFLHYANGNYIEIAAMGKVRYLFCEAPAAVRPFLEVGGGENFVFRNNGKNTHYPMVSANFGVDVLYIPEFYFTVLGEYSVSFQRSSSYSSEVSLDSVNHHISLSLGVTHTF